MRYYTDLGTIIQLIVVIIVLALVVPRARDKSFKRLTMIIAVGFILQIAFSLIWIYYWDIANRGGMPDVSIGDAFYLGSYVFWTAAAIPYFRKYSTLMGSKSRSILAAYSVAAAIIVYVTVKYWYDAAQLYGYDWFETTVWLSYPVAATICLFFLIAVALLYGYEGYGKGLLTSYWFYFLLPIMLIAGADIVNGFYYALSENSVPGRLDDVLYLAGYAVAVAAGVAILRSKLESVSVFPSVEDHLLRGGSVRIARGKGHIVEDPKGSLSYELFSRLIASEGPNQKRDGLILSRRVPSTIREQFGLDGVSIVWITTKPGEGAMDPTKPNLMAHTIMEFLSKTNNGVVLLDGIESAMTYNDFNRAVRMLEQINDFVMQYQGYLIVPIDPKIFDSRERAILERNFDTIVVPSLPV